jgi:four helix bundle protein
VPKVRDFKDLIVWQRAMELSATCHDLVGSLAGPAKRELASQIRRAAGSVTANIVEGHSRPNRGEFLHFLGIARGSLKELESHLLTLERVHRHHSPRLNRALALSDECSRMLTVMRRRLPPLGTESLNARRSTLHARRSGGRRPDAD